MTGWIRRSILPLLLLIGAALVYAITLVEHWGWGWLVVLAAALLGNRKDAGSGSWLRFLPGGLLTLAAFYLIYRYAGPLWERVAAAETKHVRHLFQWDEAFDAIPLNDAAFLRVWQPKWLTRYFQAVYNAGFTLSYWMCVFRAFFTKDVTKLGRYSLAGYLLQVPLVLPFYQTILVREVWFVQGTPDLLERGLSPAAEASTVLNCFPSMHTSIAFAALLLSMREGSRLYRWVTGIFCVSIILATMYLKVHWVIDVLAGMLFAYGCVKLADWLVGSKVYRAFVRRFERLGERLESFAAGGRSRTEQAGDREKPRGVSM
ncbi:MAG: phosphatase PAP2 family protein [Paenibacillaceae bacterium]|nr:phosphatase PAP2 family protein [Paenibacillaceae bacterium]